MNLSLNDKNAKVPQTSSLGDKMTQNTLIKVTQRVAVIFTLIWVFVSLL